MASVAYIRVSVLESQGKIGKINNCESKMLLSYLRY
jgi:hypothetical protein